MVWWEACQQAQTRPAGFTAALQAFAPPVCEQVREVLDRDSLSRRVWYATLAKAKL